MSCIECYSKINDDSKILLPCECDHCPNCLTSWIIEKLGRQPKSVSTSVVPCPNVLCLKRMKLNDIIPLLPLEHSSKISASLKRGRLDSKFIEDSKSIFSGDSEANNHIKSSMLDEFLDVAKSHVSAIMFAPCEICDRVTEKNIFCFNKICPKCEAKFCWVCKGSAQPYEFCVKNSCSGHKWFRFFSQFTFILLFVWFSRALGFVTESWTNMMHVILAIISLYVLSKIIFVQFFYHKSNQPEKIYQGIGIFISIVLLCTLPFNLLIEAVMIKIALNIILSWVFPPIVG